MRKLSLALALEIFLSVAPAFAQSTADEVATPKVEISLGYSYLNTRSADAGGCCFGMQGGSVSAAVSQNRWLSFVGDFGGYYSGNVRNTGNTLGIFSYMFGPRIYYRKNERFTAFAQQLVGGGHAGGTVYTRVFRQGAAAPTPRNAFGLSFGGGLDVTVRPKWAVRAFQADYYLTTFPNGNSNSQHNLRVTAGVVYRTGSR